MRGKVIWRGAKISSWAVINFSKYVPPQAVQTFSSKLPELCNTYGVRMNPDLVAPPATEINGNVEGVVKHVIDSAERNGNPLELILCIMPQQENKHLYATVKRLCELEFGVWTQCCLADHVKKCRPDYIANVILKINAKLGGQNSLLVDEQKKQLPLISDVPSLIIDADISHSRDGGDGVVDADWTCYKDDIIQQQNAIQAEEALKIPFVGDKESLSALAAEYETGSSILKAKIEVLDELYRVIRRTRGDGNCFFRSFMFSYLEHIWRPKMKQKWNMC